MHIGYIFLCYVVTYIYRVLLISSWRCYRRVVIKPADPLYLFIFSFFPRAALCCVTNYRWGGGELTIVITAVHLVRHVSRTVESFVAPLMQRNAMAVIAHPLVRSAPTVISMHRSVVAAELVAIVVRAINSAIATLMQGYTITALALPFLAYHSLILSR